MTGAQAVGGTIASYPLRFFAPLPFCTPPTHTEPPGALKLVGPVGSETLSRVSHPPLSQGLHDTTNLGDEEGIIESGI